MAGYGTPHPPSLVFSLACSPSVGCPILHCSAYSDSCAPILIMIMMMITPPYTQPKVSTILGTFSKSFGGYAAARFFQGVFNGMFGLTAFVLANEYVGKGWVGTTGTLSNFIFPVGELILAGIAYSVPAWRAQTLVSCLTFVPCKLQLRFLLRIFIYLHSLYFFEILFFLKFEGTARADEAGGAPAHGVPPLVRSCGSRSVPSRLVVALCVSYSIPMCNTQMMSPLYSKV